MSPVFSLEYGLVKTPPAASLEITVSWRRSPLSYQPPHSCLSLPPFPFYLQTHVQTDSPEGKYPLLAVALNDLFVSPEKVNG